MNLQPLCTSVHVSVYFDTANNWLFIDWHGDLTLAKVQLACLELAHCYLSHSYPRVLNSNAQVLSITPDVSDWLVSTFMPALDMAGVQQMAWVFPPQLRDRNSVLDTFTRFPHMAISLFDDVEDAVSWLQHTTPVCQKSDYVTFSHEERVRDFFHLLAQHLDAEMLRAVPLAPTLA